MIDRSYVDCDEAFNMWSDDNNYIATHRHDAVCFVISTTRPCLACVIVSGVIGWIDLYMRGA